MIFPSIDKLLNIVDSKYQLVHIVATRSKQMTSNDHYQLRQEEYKSRRGIGRALEEVEKNLLKVVDKNKN